MSVMTSCFGLQPLTPLLPSPPHLALTKQPFFHSLLTPLHVRPPFQNDSHPCVYVFGKNAKDVVVYWFGFKKIFF